jgi:rare lipoprotein A
MNKIGIILFFLFLLAHPCYAQSWKGKASYYTYESARQAGNSGIMANGQRMVNSAMTCAFNGLPFNTWLRVTNLKNGRSCIVRVTDRGGFKRYGRVIDLSKRAFESIANIKEGVILVKIEVVK